MAFFPRLQAREQRSVIGLVRVRHHAVATDGLIRLDGVDLTEDSFDFFKYFAGAFERSPGWKLHVYSQNALVLFGNKPGGNHLAEEPGAQNHEHYDGDRNESFAY